MVQMAGIIADLIDIGSHQRRQTVILLQIHRKYGLTEDFQGLNILLAVDGNPNDIRPGLFQNLDLTGGGVDIHGAGGRHTLYGYGGVPSYGQGAYTNFPGLTGFYLGIHCAGSFLEGLV